MASVTEKPVFKFYLILINLNVVSGHCIGDCSSRPMVSPISDFKLILVLWMTQALRELVTKL